MAISFDPTTKRIVLDSASVEIRTIYSRWKDWVQSSDNAKYHPAFSVVGGDELGGGLFVASYFFLENGWKIRPKEESHTLVLTGNISVQGGGIPLVPTLGVYNVSAQYVTPVAAQGIATSGSSGPSAGQIAEAVRAEIAIELSRINSLNFTVPGKVDANIHAVNNIAVQGAGTEPNPWGPV